MTQDPIGILVTGASGFVGRHLIPALVTAYPGATIHTPVVRVEEAAQVDKVVRATVPDVCIHLAAVAAIPAAQQNPDNAWKVNFQGTMNVAWAITRHAPDCQLIFVSSADAYGASFRAGIPLNEDAPLYPMNVYGETKAACDFAMGGMAAQGLHVVRLRSFNHTGRGQSPQFVVAAFAEQIARIKAGTQDPVMQVGNIETWRDFLDVRDVCAAYVACIRKRNLLAPGTIINVASGTPRRVGDILSSLATLAGVNVDIRVNPSRVRATDLPMACGDATRAHELLGWGPKVPWSWTLEDVLNGFNASLH